jgi:hypothetical protein
MRRDLKNTGESKKPDNDAFASVVRSFGKANSRLQVLAIESVGRAVEIQSQFVGKAYDTYITALSQLGRMFFVGYRTPTARPQVANLTEKKAANRQVGASDTAKVDLDAKRPRTAAQSMSTKRKTGTVAKSRLGSQKSTKVKRKGGSVQRKKG